MVEWKKLGEVCNFQNGFAFKSNLFKSEGLPIVRITNITSTDVDMSDCKYFDIGDYCKINLIPFQIKRDDILLAMSGATTGKIGKYKRDKTAYLNQRVGKFIPQASVLNNGFLYHFLLNKTNELYIMAGGGAQPNLSSNKLMGELSIPLPSLSEQERIVGILDTFTSSIENLKTQISLRRKQYEHYRDKLLDIEGKPGVEMKTLGDVCKLERGIRVVKKDLQENGVIPVYQNSLTPLGFYERSNFPANTSFVICAGAAGEIGFSDIPFWAADDCTCMICPLLINGKYIYHFLITKQHVLKSQVRKASVPRLSKDVIAKLSIPLPSLEEQSRIVSILDEFEASIKNLEAQLAQRQKQYEYYREKLLTFERE